MIGRRVTLLAAALTLAGCASLSPDGGFSPVAQTAKERLGADITWARTDAERDAVSTRVSELLREPLSADGAVQVALLNNRGLQAAFYELGISDADRVQATRLANPGFSFGRLQRGDEVEINRGIHINLARLLTLPLATEMEARRFRQTQGEVTLQVLGLASQTRKAHVQAVAATEAVRYQQQVQEAADAGAVLAKRMAAVGNWSKLQQAREQGFYADATLNLARALQVQGVARERLTRLMGLWGAQTAFTLPERLPDLPKTPQDLPDVERTALAQRLDVQGARLATEPAAKALGLSQVTRLVNVLDLA